MDFNWLTTDTVEKAGAIVVALVAIIISYLEHKGFMKVVTNHLAHDHADSDKLTEALTKLCDKIDSL